MASLRAPSDITSNWLSASLRHSSVTLRVQCCGVPAWLPRETLLLHRIQMTGGLPGTQTHNSPSHLSCHQVQTVDIRGTCRIHDCGRSLHSVFMLHVSSSYGTTEAVVSYLERSRSHVSCCSVHDLCPFGMSVSFQTCLCVCSFRRSEGGACFLLKEFEAENFSMS